MESEFKVEFDSQNIKITKIDSLLVVEPQKDGFQTLIDVELNQDLFDWLDLVGNDKSFKGILFVGDENFFSDIAFAEYLASLTGEPINLDEPHPVKKIIDRRKRSIQINMLNSYIKKIITMPKIIFVSLSSHVASPFWGLSLAADYRIAHPNLVVHLNSKEFGLHPSGGVPFFMQKQVGISKTQEILYNVNILAAEELKKLGFINQFTSLDNYRKDAISYAREILEATSYEYFYYTKQLINHKLLKEFESYSDLEYKMELH